MPSIFAPKLCPDSDLHPSRPTRYLEMRIRSVMLVRHPPSLEVPPPPQHIHIHSHST
ncbi:hypothetical protein PISMIDRAFT_689504, partial [Pisolithus microcarpus 441]